MDWSKYFTFVDNKWVQNFRIINFQDSGEYGVCYQETKRVWITLHRHESIDNIINTINHETLHQAIADESVKGIDDDVNESAKMHGEEEHELMKRVIWAMNDWILD